MSSKETLSETSSAPLRILSGKLQSISIPCFEIYPYGSSQFVTYRILVEGQRGSFIVYRRYNHFHALMQKMKQIDPSSEVSFPPKTLMHNFDESFLQQRRAALQYFLLSLLEKPAAMNSEPVKVFLNPNCEIQGSDMTPSRHYFSTSMLSETNRQSIPRFTTKELNRVFDQFLSKAISPVIDCEDFINICCNELHFRSAYAAYRLYHTLDSKATLRLGIKETLCALVMISNSPPEQRVGFCFKVHQATDAATSIPRDSFVSILSSWSSIFSQVYNFDPQTYTTGVMDEIRMNKIFTSDGGIDINGYCMIAAKNATTKKIFSFS